SITFVPAMIAIAITGKVQEKENLFVRGLKAVYAPLLGSAVRAPWAFIAASLVLLLGAGLLFNRLGQEFI
ncbi:efflux RND transporter permease subunit, partial [Klebsiella pneumoniae]|uniref:efflux RND transporter permease subunit n=1 Tax=Klebsiella pneumoniae TaxID=573 RepID=UPI0013D7F86F